jgi:hypothetical protein
LSSGTSRKRKEANVFSGRQTHRGKSQKLRSLDRERERERERDRKTESLVY